MSEKTAEVIEKGLEYSRISEGAFDITIEPLSSLWNFTGKDPHVPPETAVREARERVGYQKVSLEGNMVTFADDDTTIDLGAIAKGFIADEMKDYLLEEGGGERDCQFGGKCALRGLQAGRRSLSNWNPASLRRPERGGRRSGHPRYVSGSPPVSMNAILWRNGVNYHHLLNPRTGYPYEKRSDPGDDYFSVLGGTVMG